METQNYQFSFIITYKHSPERLNLLRKTIAWLYATKLNPELIIIEQGKQPSLNEHDHRARHYEFVKSGNSFHKTWAYNIGIKYATTDTIIFSDCDIIMNLNDFKKSLETFKSGGYEVMSPYDRVIDLQRNENSLGLDNLDKISRPGYKTIHRPWEGDGVRNIPMCSGMVFFTREGYNKSGGWIEDFVDWGCEDDAQSLKVERLKLKTKVMPNRCYHLWHHKTAPNEPLYQRNIQILQQVQKMNDQQMIQWINTKRATQGDINKYE